MIGRIENINSSIGEVKIVASRVRKNLPKINSLVKIEVLEKLKGNYKILVDGELYQSKLPVKAKAGDIIMGQLANLNPLTIKLDSFSGIELSASGTVGIILKELGLAKTELAEKLITELIKTHKHLSKEKIERFLDFAGNSLTSLDKFQFGLLIAMIWDDGDAYSTREKRAVFSRVFDISFWELSDRIFEEVINLKKLNLPESVEKILDEKTVFDFKEFEEKKVLSGISSKVRSYIELTDFIEEGIAGNRFDSLTEKSFSRLSDLLVKYVLQKALLNKYKIYIDFAIVRNDYGYRLWKFSYNKIVNKLGEAVYKFETYAEDKVSSIDYELYLVGDKVRGKIETTDIEEERRQKFELNFKNAVRKQAANQAELNWFKRRRNYSANREENY